MLGRAEKRSLQDGLGGAGFPSVGLSNPCCPDDPSFGPETSCQGGGASGRVVGGPGPHELRKKPKAKSGKIRQGT